MYFTIKTNDCWKRNRTCLIYSINNTKSLILPDILGKLVMGEVGHYIIYDSVVCYYYTWLDLYIGVRWA